MAEEKADGAEKPKSKLNPQLILLAANALFL